MFPDTCLSDYGLEMLRCIIVMTASSNCKEKLTYLAGLLFDRGGAGTRSDRKEAMRWHELCAAS
jgi:hypothetical protein